MRIAHFSKKTMSALDLFFLTVLDEHDARNNLSQKGIAKYATKPEIKYKDYQKEHVAFVKHMHSLLSSKLEKENVSNIITNYL